MFSANDKSGEFSFDTGKQCDMNFARCVCFFQSNIFLPKFGIHVSYMNEDQFRKCYKDILVKMGCKTTSDIKQVEDEVRKEIQRRMQLPNATYRRSLFIKKNYERKFPDIYKLKEDFLHPDFNFIKTHCHSKADLLNCGKKNFISHGKEVYSFPLFNMNFCKEFCKELNHFQDSSMPREKPNSMNNYGILLNELGFDDYFMVQLRKIYLEPLSCLLFPELSSNFDSHKVFTVDYAEDRDTALNFHFDNSEVTLNVCLEAYGEGGELYFGNSAEINGLVYIHQVGRAILHRGSQMHCVLPLIEGKRRNMVMWMRNSSVRNLRCPMCGENPQLERVSYGCGDGFTITNLTTESSVI